MLFSRGYSMQKRLLLMHNNDHADIVVIRAFSKFQSQVVVVPVCTWHNNQGADCRSSNRKHSGLLFLDNDIGNRHRTVAGMGNVSIAVAVSIASTRQSTHPKNRVV